MADVAVSKSKYDSAGNDLGGNLFPKCANFATELDNVSGGGPYGLAVGDTMRHVIAIALAAACCAADADAQRLDRITLANGRVLIGAVEVDAADGVTVRLAGAGAMFIAREKVARVERGIVDAPASSARAPSTTAPAAEQAPAPVDYDTVAAQRHQEAVAKQKAADEEMRARVERERSKAQLPAERWVVPKGSAAAEPPAWTRGEWSWNGSAWVIGAKTVGVDGQSPAAIHSVLVGPQWCCIELDVSSGFGRPRIVIRANGDGCEMGTVVVASGIPDAVELWLPLVRK